MKKKLKHPIEDAIENLVVTPKEAVKTLQRLEYYVDKKPTANPIAQERTKKALDLAIKALEKKPPNNERLRIYAAAICDAFEDLLDEHDITIPDDEREGEEDEARIFGLTYDRLENKVVDILKKLVTSE